MGVYVKIDENNPDHVAAIFRFGFETIMEGVKAAGDEGAPEGAMYAALMQCGMSLRAFNLMINLLEIEGCIKRSGFLIHFVKDLEARSHHMEALFLKLGFCDEPVKEVS